MTIDQKKLDEEQRKGPRRHVENPEQAEDVPIAGEQVHNKQGTEDPQGVRDGRMTPQQEKNTPKNPDPPHTA